MCGPRFPVITLHLADDELFSKAIDMYSYSAVVTTTVKTSTASSIKSTTTTTSSAQKTSSSTSTKSTATSTSTSSSSATPTIQTSSSLTTATKTTSSASNAATNIAAGWTYLGCYADSSARVMGANWTSGQASVSSCLAICQNQGQSAAALGEHIDVKSCAFETLASELTRMHW